MKNLLYLLSITLLIGCGNEPKKEKFSYERVKEEPVEQVSSDALILNSNDQKLFDKSLLKANAGEEITLVLNHTGKIAKELFEIVYSEGGDPNEIVEKRGMKQVTDTSAIEQAVEKVINDNPDQVAKAKINPKLAGWFVGQVMKATGGKANPKSVNEIVSKKLNL